MISFSASIHAGRQHRCLHAGGKKSRRLEIQKSSPQGPLQRNLHTNTRLTLKQTCADGREVQWLFRSARGRIRVPRGSEEPEIPDSEWEDYSGEVVAQWLLRGQMKRLVNKNEMTIPGVTFQINNEGD